VLPTPKELSAKRPDPLILYANTGAKEVLVSSPAPVRLRILGPFAAAEPKRRPPKLEDQDNRFTLDEGFLSLGLDKAASAFYRLQERPPSQASGHGFLAFGEKPFTEDKIAEGQKMIAHIGITTNEVSALLRAFPAMMSFFGIVEGTSGLEDILMKVVDTPSMWSIIRQRGVSANFKFPSGHIAPADSADWGVSGHPSAWYLPMQLELNGKLALNLTFVVTDPSPPLLPCAGVVGFLAQKPDDPETYLTFRVISATRAPLR